MKIIVSETVKKSAGEIICQMLLESVTSITLSAGLILGVCSIIQMEIHAMTSVVAAAAGAGVCLLASHWKHGYAVAALFMGAATIGSCIFLWDAMLNGMLVFFNAIADAFGNNSHILLKYYQLLSEETALQDLSIFLVLLTALCSCLAYLLLKVSGFLSVMLWGAIALTVICLDISSDIQAKVMLAAGLVCSGTYGAYFGRKYAGMQNRNMLACVACAGAFIMAGILSAVTGMLFPADSYQQNPILMEVKEDLAAHLEEMRYGGKEINTLPKGNLQKAEIWEGSEKIALVVTEDEPQSLYLRGFVGGRYSSNKWEDLDRSIYYENRDLFYWLHEDGLSADTQMATLRKMLTEARLEEKTFSVSVTNEMANREYLYTPYELIQLDGKTLENDGDSYQKAKGILGAKEYAFETYGNLVKDFPQLVSEGYIHLASSEDAWYAEAESHYNAFVYENYTELPDDLKQLFQQELGYDASDREEHVNYYSAIQKIRKYLEKHMTYGNYCEALPQEQDFVQFFLEESKIGNPVHYATAAALMFRYYGIPSRYVEGYVITPEDIKDLSGKSVVEVPGTNGHAWVEIYIDGLGWVPIEMTPEYYGLMQEPDLTKGLEPSQTMMLEESKEEEEQQEEDKNAGALKQKLVTAFLDLAKLLMALIILFDVFCLLFFAYALIRRIKANRSRKKAFRQKENRLAVQSMVGYMTKLLLLAGEIYTEQERDLYSDSYQIGEKAAFSLHEISEQEREQIKQSKDALLKALKQRKGWYEKWVLKYIERLY